MLPTFFGLIFVLLYGPRQCSAVNDFSSSNYFCKKFHRQQVIDDSQLEGIWYVMEKIIHTEDRDYRLNLTTCPVLHISRDNVESTTYNPIYKNYDTTYGAQYPHRLPQQEPENINLKSNPTNRDSTFTSQQDYNRQLDDFDRRTTYDYERRRAMQNVYAQLYGTKYLNLYLSDGRDTVIHHVRYNSSEPSYWIISGPEYGVPDNLQHFIGNMQVLKVVGSHMVLTVCKHLKEVKQLYSLVLSRENFLSSQDVSGVHRMLISQALRTNYVEKTCSGALMLGIWFVVEKINHTYIDNYIGRNPIMSTCPIVHLSSYQPYSNEDLDEEKYRRKRPKYPSNELNRFQENDNGLYKDPYQIHYVPDYTYPDFTQYLRMYYETEENSVEAFYRYEIIDPGYWISPKLDGIRSPKQFAGNVQILKAVGSHMVLTFCDGRHRYLYTLILARQRFLSRKELIGIHNLISRQKLSTFSVEKFCSSSNSLFASYRIYIIIFGFFVNKLSY